MDRFNIYIYIYTIELNTITSIWNYFFKNIILNGEIYKRESMNVAKQPFKK